MKYVMNFNQEEKKWVEVEAKRRNMSLIGTDVVVKATDLSLVQKIPTNKENLYFKSTSSSSYFEAKLSRFLFSQFPEQTVGVLAAHEENPWFLMKEFAGTSLRQIKDKKLWKQCLQEYAEFQVNASQHVNTLLELGVPDRRMNVLKNEIQNHLSDMCQTGLNETETMKVLSIQSELIKMCDQIEGEIPYSIDHGDLHSGNIQYVNNQPVFYDWGDASVTHPFFSTRIFWNAIYEIIDSDSLWLETVNEFRPYYLEPWTIFASMQELEKLLLISDQLACVYRALGWHLYINPYRKDKEDTLQRPAQWLKLLLEHREIGIK